MMQTIISLLVTAPPSISILCFSPAHCAAAKGDLEVLKLLHQDKRGDLWLKNQRGEYAIHEAALAKQNGEIYIPQMQSCHQCLYPLTS